MKSINDMLLENCKAMGSTDIPFSGSGNFYGSGVPIYTSMDAWDRAMDSWYGGSNSQLADAARKLGDPSQSSLVMAAVRFLGSVLPEPQLQAKKPAEGTDGQKGDSVVIPDHPMIQLWDKPNEFYSGSTLKKALAFSWVLKGEAFIIKVWNKGHSEVLELWYEPHWTIRPVWPIDGSEFISGYEVNRNGQWYPLEIDDVIHLRDGIDPYNPRSGLCGLISITRELYGDQEVSSFYSGLVSGSAVPPFLVSVDQGMQMSTDAMKDFQRDLVRNTTGDKKGQPVVTKGAKAYKLGWSPTEMNLAEARFMPEDRFCAVMGIPAVMMELGTGHAHSIYNNVKSAEERAYRSYVVPLLRHIEEELQTQLLIDFEEEGSKVFLRHDLSKIQALQEDEDAKATRLDRLYRAGIIKRSEARSAGGYGPSDPDNKDECDNVFFIPTGGTLVRPGEEPLGSGEQIINIETGEVRAGGPPPAPELPPGAQQALEAVAGNGNGKQPKEPPVMDGQKPKPKLLKPAPPAAKAMPSGGQMIKSEDIQQAIRWLKRNRFEQAAQMITAKSVTNGKRT